MKQTHIFICDKSPIKNNPVKSSKENLRINFYQGFTILFVLLLLSSCADHRVASIPDTHLPPAHLPQIGTPSPNASDKRPNVPQRSKAVDSMISKAKRELDRERPEDAFQTLERALTIDGQDPMVWHLMAKAREMQGKFHQAESLARKSNTLAGENPGLRKKNWRLIGDVLDRQGNTQKPERLKMKN